MKKIFPTGSLKKLILDIEFKTAADPVFSRHNIACHTRKAKRHLYYAVRELDKVNYMKVIERITNDFMDTASHPEKKSY